MMTQFHEDAWPEGDQPHIKITRKWRCGSSRLFLDGQHFATVYTVRGCVDEWDWPNKHRVRFVGSDEVVTTEKRWDAVNHAIRAAGYTPIEDLGMKATMWGLIIGNVYTVEDLRDGLKIGVKWDNIGPVRSMAIRRWLLDYDLRRLTS